MLISRHFAVALKVWSKIGQFSATSSFLLWHTWSRSRSDFHLPFRAPEIIRKSFFSSLVFADRAESRSTSLRELETDDLSWLFFFFVATTSLNEARSRQKVAKVARCLQSRRFWEKVVSIEILPLSSVGYFQAWIKWSVISRNWSTLQFQTNIKGSCRRGNCTTWRLLQSSWCWRLVFESWLSRSSWSEPLSKITKPWVVYSMSGRPKLAFSFNSLTKEFEHSHVRCSRPKLSHLFISCVCFC